LIHKRTFFNQIPSDRVLEVTSKCELLEFVTSFAAHSSGYQSSATVYELDEMKLLFLLLAIWWSSARANWEEGDGGQVLWNHNCEFTGNNIQMRDCSPQTCGACCLANPRCTQFTWMNTNSSKPCVLKNGRRNQRPAFARGFVCGYVPTRICMPGEDFIF
jgi:hypothetical protein